MTTRVDGVPGPTGRTAAVRAAGTGLRVALLGHGAIGRVVARELLRGGVDGATLVGVVTRSPDDPGLPVPRLGLDEALAACDVVVECAGPDALLEVVEPVLAAGRDLVVSSIAALLDPRLAGRLDELGPGRLRCTHGALGGLDLLASAAAVGGLDRAVLRTTKKPAALVQPWMDEAEARRVRDAAEDVLVFAGTPAEASRLFPQSLNVAAALALAVGDPDVVRVELHADPAADLTTHRIEAEGPQGSYVFQVQNKPSPDNPRTSAVVPYSILRTLSGLTARPPLIA
ncbi:aspartate dehydrogenase domain-containing protein [Blastococcus sp. TF02A-26]|uniref:aspartate dehydrogenase domain-containing protein n=1 Tax=Blastococcus sp. TF02A-26 TaxID=2250577 RepID=UPI000DEBAAB6|nr:aspartate dehydrogenase domain-containing protein [Blastococcus sp. TF02A-26]RBY87354.1 aspartate dehydrogenase [Blastococcus sp. TF02A-26]